MPSEDYHTSTLDGARGHALQFAVEEDPYADYSPDEPDEDLIDEDIEDPEPDACNICGFDPCDCDGIRDRWRDR